MKPSQARPSPRAIHYAPDSQPKSSYVTPPILQLNSPSLRGLCTEEERQAREAFYGKLARVEDLYVLIEGAKSCIGVTKDSSNFSQDVLRVEMSRPHQPPLNIIDLPGFIYSGKDTESDKNIEIIHKMVHK